MTFSFYRSVRGVVQTTLLLAGLSLTVSSDVCAEEAPEEEPQSSEQEPAQDPPEEAPTEPLPTTDDSGWETELHEMMDEAEAIAIEELYLRDDELELDSDRERNGRINDERSVGQTLSVGRYLGSALLAYGVGFGTGNFVNGSKERGLVYLSVDLSFTALIIVDTISSCVVHPSGIYCPDRIGIEAIGFLVSRVVQVVDCLIEPLAGRRIKSFADSSSRSQRIVWRPVVGHTQGGIQVAGRF